MGTKEVKIQIPKGYEIDKVNSTSNYIKLKPIKKDVTYGDVCEKNFEDSGFYISSTGRIEEMASLFWNDDKNNATNKEQLKRILALTSISCSPSSPDDSSFSYKGEISIAPCS